jgi:hypothetical protein
LASTNRPVDPSSGIEARSTTIFAASSAVVGAAARFSEPPRSVWTQPGQMELTLIDVSMSVFDSATVRPLSAALDV